MNIPPSFLRSPEFLLLKDRLGDSALHAVFALGCAFQMRRSTQLAIPSKRHLAIYCDTPEVSADDLWDALVPDWLRDLGNGVYEMPFFSENNTQLIAAWENGNRRKAGRERNSSERNGTEPNGIEHKGIELNRTELDAMASPKRRSSVAPNGVNHSRY